MVRRPLVGGPLHGMTITELPEDQKNYECGRLTGRYHLEDDGVMHYRSIVNAPGNEAPCAFNAPVVPENAMFHPPEGDTEEPA